MNTIFQCDMNLVCYVQDAKLQQNHLVSLLLDFSTLLGNFQVLMDKIRHIMDIDARGKRGVHGGALLDVEH